MDRGEEEEEEKHKSAAEFIAEVGRRELGK
ncbi:hypothetical protein CCACVL1_29255 [Corchorus capsularis]|uniref:Uncharacterized protein n=1 Tax=Corchorus capsularis TaxID=210143 RepID=A0A1R3G2R1_COCAP|nr:hypothetical protein CCACVL1_29255 [Corchorus capsularis]